MNAHHGADHEDPLEIPSDVNIPDATEIFKAWHLWLVYVLTVVTLALSIAVAYNVTTTKSVDRRVRTIVGENRTILCDLQAIQKSTPATTAREKATDRYFRQLAGECERTAP